MGINTRIQLNGTIDVVVVQIVARTILGVLLGFTNWHRNGRGVQAAVSGQWSASQPVRQQHAFTLEQSREQH